jgi:hypothetical protein
MRNLTGVSGTDLSQQSHQLIFFQPYLLSYGFVDGLDALRDFDDFGVIFFRQLELVKPRSQKGQAAQLDAISFVVHTGVIAVILTTQATDVSFGGDDTQLLEF